MAASRRLRRAVGTVVLDRPWILLGLAALVAIGLWVKSTRDAPYTVRVTVDNALSLANGMDVQASGVDVGKIERVSYVDGRAVVELGIRDRHVRPLRRGTTAQVRWGSTVGNGNRRIELTPGPADAPPIPDGGTIGRARDAVPVEIDQVVDTFRPATRADAQRLARNVAGDLAGRTGSFNRGARRFDDALRAAGAVAADVDASGTALRTLLRQGAQVTEVLDARRPRIDALLHVLSETFDELGQNATAFAATVADVAPTLRQARGTLDRVPRTVVPLGETLAALRPGIRRLPALAGATNPALAQLRAISADGRALVRTAERSAPGATDLLDRARPVLAQATPALERTGEIARCVAPYAPDLAGFVSNWASWSQEYDHVSHIARPLVYLGQSGINEMAKGTSTKGFVDTTSLRFNGLPAPGFLTGRPAFDPSCGVGKDAVDPAKDWDDR